MKGMTKTKKRTHNSKKMITTKGDKQDQEEGGKAQGTILLGRRQLPLGSE
jgi:hypothetical protein